MKKAILNLIILLMWAGIQNVNAQWQPTSGPSGGKINCLTKYSSNILAGTDGGIYVSSNNGLTWMQLVGSPAFVTCIAVNGTDIFAGSFGYGVFLSANNGNSWTAVNNGFSPNGYVNALGFAGNNIIAAMGMVCIYRKTTVRAGCLKLVLELG